MKLLFSDLDETLLSSDKTISQGNLKAIREMTSAGHGFVLCTGRPLYSAVVLAKQYGFVGKGYYIVSYNGGQIVDMSDNRELYHEGISKDVVKFLFEKAHEWDLNVQTYNDDCILVDEDSEYIKWYSDRIRMPYKVTGNVLTALKADPLKCIVAHMTDHEKLEKFRAEVGSMISDVTSNIFSNPVLLEFGSLKASKGIAVEKLAGILGVAIEDTIACGDEENDISMILAAGTGVGMVNAVPSVLEICDVVTKNDNNHDAIAEIINKYVI